jgi:virginiamycin B lyase
VDIAATPNGGAWFTEPGTNSIGHISAEGALDHYTAHGSVVHPFAIVAGPTGDAWFTEGVPVGDRGRGGDRIGHIDVTGAITFHRIPSSDAGAVGIALGPEHTVWFTEQRLGQIGRLDPDGSVVEFSAGAAQPDQITLGPDDNLWFTAFGAHRISRMTKDGRLIQTYDVAAGGTDPVDITSQDGQLWFTVIDGHLIGQLDPSTGTVGWIDVPGVGTRGPANLTADPARGGIWFTDLDSATVAYLSAPNDGAPQIYPRVQLAVDSSPIGIAAANAGVVWFAEQSGNAIGRLTG